MCHNLRDWEKACLKERVIISRVRCLILKRRKSSYLKKIKNHKDTAKSFNFFLINFVSQKVSENWLTASMNQLNIDCANAMSYEFFHTSSFSLQQNLNDNDQFMKVYSLTSYSTLCNINKRSFFTFKTDDNIILMMKYEIKRRKRNFDSCHHFFNISLSTSLCHSSLTSFLNVSSTKLKRVLESIFNQVDWLEMTLAIVKNWASSIYSKVIEKILPT